MPEITQVNKLAVFCSGLQTLPDDSATIESIIKSLDSTAKSVHGNVSQGSLSNCHGDWYEWLLGILAWNLCLENEQKVLAFSIPNISQFDGASLYNEVLFGMVQHLRSELSTNAIVSLITSNPDFVIFCDPALPNLLTSVDPIFNIDESSIVFIENLYKNFVAKADFGSIRAYASAKLSLRPDRRLQIPHEGSLTKALYVHLQTRLWITNPRQLRYYALSTEVKNADIEALRTVATHSITTVASAPQRAVDEVFATKTIGEAKAAMREIYRQSIEE